MPTTPLKVVPSAAPVAAAPVAAETRAQRIARLQAEARQAAGQHVELFQRLLATATAMAQDIADGGEAYPVGVRQLAARLGQDLPAQVTTMKAISARAA